MCGITCLTVFQGVVFACVIGADVTAFGVECASLDDVLGAALVGLVLGLFDYMVVFYVSHLTSDHPAEQPNQDRIAGVLVSPFVDDGIRLLAEAFPSCRCEPIL